MRSKNQTNAEANSGSVLSRSEQVLAARNKYDEASAYSGLMLAADVVCPQEQGLVIDGPFIETKELIVG